MTSKTTQRAQRGRRGNPALHRLSGGAEGVGGPGVPSLPLKSFRKSRLREAVQRGRPPGGWGPRLCGCPKGSTCVYLCVCVWGVYVGGRAQEGLASDSSGESAPGREPMGSK